MIRLLIAAWCGLALGVAVRGADQVPPVLPVADFARADVTTGLSLSPDGKTIAYALGVDRDWVLVLRDWDTGKVRNIGRGAGAARPRWVGGERVLYGAGASMDRDEKDFIQSELNPAMVLASRLEGENAGQVLALRFDPIVGASRQLYHVPAYPHVDRVNLRFGRIVPEVTNPGRVVSWWADAAGLVRVGVQTDGAKSRVIWRDRPDGEWRVAPGLDYARDEFTPMHLSADGRTLLLLRRTPEGTRGLYRYDLADGLMGDLLLSHDRYDLMPGGSPVFAPRTRDLLGVYFFSDKVRAHWFDPELAAVQQALDQARPGRNNVVTSLSDDHRRMIVLSWSAREPGTYFQFDLTAKSLKPILARQPWIKAEQMAEEFPASFRARDGQTVHGRLTLPAGRPRKQLPLVIWAGDGPGGRTGPGYDAERQFLANRGYAVLAVDYRGSGGYGRDYLEHATGRLGSVPSDDLADAARWLIAEGVADAGRIAIVGRRLGGTCALLSQTREPGLYRCGVSIDGATDWLRHLAHRRELDPAGYPFLVDRAGDPERDAAALREASPISHVGRLATPVLLVTGPGETVSREDTKTYRAALARLGKPHEVLAKEDDVDGFVFSKGRAELLSRIEQFLARHLAPAKR